MAGVKQFDQDEVLDRAMAVFWERGYEATSIQDLVEATGLNRGSLYATFRDKKQLFLAVLARYAHRVGNPLLAELADPDPRRAIERMFAAILQRTSDSTQPRGCLITNTALECPRSGDDISRTIAAWVGQQESALYHVLLRAQTTGALSRTQDCRALARFFVGVAQGLNVVHKAMADPAVLQDMVRVAMQVWDAPHGLPPNDRSRQERKQLRQPGHGRISSTRPHRP
jgi:TetR/AcrR family transcriptional regulator, transcriptional repressor for nem operon